MERYTRNVLVVEPNPIERERLAAALESEGFQALLCSDPTQPEYTCLGARAGTCPLASQDAIVVLDMSLDSDAVMSGTPAEDLLGLYLESGHPVVALDGGHRGDETGQLIRLRRHPETDALLTAVWRLALPYGTHPPTGGGEGRAALKTHGPALSASRTTDQRRSRCMDVKRRTDVRDVTVGTKETGAELEGLWDPEGLVAAVARRLGPR